MSVSAQTVRDYLALETDSTSRYSDATINSNLSAASAFLQRATNRYFENQAAFTYTATSYGGAFIDIPGARTVTSVSRDTIALTLNETYWTVPDTMQTGVIIGVQLYPVGPLYRPPTWFDRGTDLPDYQIRSLAGYGSLPYDISVVGDFGYVDPVASVPEYGIALKVYAAWLTKRPDALLSGGTATPDGNIIPLEELPPEVSEFIAAWKIGSHSAVST